jgi:hypothetical protein
MIEEKRIILENDLKTAQSERSAGLFMSGIVGTLTTAYGLGGAYIISKMYEVTGSLPEAIKQYVTGLEGDVFQATGEAVTDLSFELSPIPMVLLGLVGTSIGVSLYRHGKNKMKAIQAKLGSI